jgi:hypothetical protein
MPISVAWESEAKTTVLYTFVGSWTWREFDSAVMEAHSLIDSVNYRVNIVVDMRRSFVLPSGAISYIRRMPGRKHPRTRVTVMVGASNVIHAIYQMIVTLYPAIATNFLMVNSFEEAYEVFAQRESDQ